MATHEVARKALVIFLPALGLAAFFYIFRTDSERDALEREESLTVGAQGDLIVGEIGAATSDLMFLAGLREIDELFREEGFLEPEAQAELGEKFLLLADTRDSYDQIRLLDETGQEIVRIDFNSGSPAIVLQSELQNKAGRYYFDDTLDLGRGEVFVSPLDLNIEHGEIEQPLKPMIRLGTPVFDERGDKRGILLLNYMGAHLLETFGSVAHAETSQSMLLNSDGYYLQGPDPEDAWAFMYEERMDRTFGAAYGIVWESVASEESGQFETSEGLFTFSTVHPLLAGQVSSTGSGDAVGSSAAMLDAHGYEWKIVTLVPPNVLYAQRNALLGWMLPTLVIVTIALAIGSFWLARARTAEERAHRGLESANQQLSKNHQEIKVLNRSLESKVRERTKDLRLANEKLRDNYEQLRDARAQAATDGLTGLSNHRAFHERIGVEASRAQESRSSLGLIMLDVDNFKGVNDSQGHQAGDSLLRHLAAVLADVAGQENAYRYGGDEFTAVLPGTDHEATLAIAERIRRALENSADGDGITVSVGVASFPEAASVEELVYGADVAMYWAKSEGKNRVGDWASLVKGRTDGALPWFAADGGVRAPEVVTALGEALAAKDPSTRDHTERCSSWAAKVTQELGLEDAETSIVRLAALLHDVGKLAVPDEILFKPGPLNGEEWDYMKRHTTAGLQMLGQIRSLTDVTPSILHHHEHFDGSGYPNGLAGDEIPVGARILLVTDAFDAMTNDRPYRRAMPVKAAIEELTRHKGSQFDPAVVDAFIRVLARGGNQPWQRTGIPVTDSA